MYAVRSILITILLVATASSSNAEATAVELDAAVARMSSAMFKVEVLSSCGIPQNQKEKDAATNIAKLMALQKDDLSRKLSNNQFVTANLRTMDSGLVESMRIRAKELATPEECAKSENKALWAHLMNLAKSLNQL